MVTNFEDYTNELNEFEKTHILPIVIGSWQKKQIKEYVNMKTMIKGVNDWATTKPLYRPTKTGKNSTKIYKIDGPRMRKIIHHIRVKNLVPKLIASSKGYYLTDDDKEVEMFIKSCRERANSFLEVANAMTGHLNIDKIGGYRTIKLYTEFLVNQSIYEVIESPRKIWDLISQSEDGKIKLRHIDGRTIEIEIKAGDKILTKVIDKRNEQQ